MKLQYKPMPLDAVKSSVWGLLWTRRGLQIVKPGDYIVKAPTGCTWRIPEAQSKYYEVVR